MIEQLKKERLIVILRGLNCDQALLTAEAMLRAGVRFLEVTFSQGDQNFISNTPKIIRAITDRFPELYTGAGTVLSSEQVDAAYEGGAKYILSPNTDQSVVRRTVELGMVSIPGAFSPSEIVDAYNWGASFVKVFPAGNLGADYIKAIRAPLRHIPLLAVGGVSLENMDRFYNAGVAGFGIGGNLVKKSLIDEGNYKKLTEIATQYVNHIAMLSEGTKNV